MVRVSDMTTHFSELEGTGKVMILGCHDLTLFNNRNLTNTGRWRSGLKMRFRELAVREKPLYVLHHPHTTVKAGTWRIPWTKLRELLPSVDHHAGAGRYWEPRRRPSEYDSLDAVLEATRGRHTSSVDVVVSTGERTQKTSAPN